MQEEVKRPPLYYFEEVEEKRARERELLASGISQFLSRKSDCH